MRTISMLQGEIARMPVPKLVKNGFKSGFMFLEEAIATEGMDILEPENRLKS